MSDWDTGVFDCMIDPKICIVSLFCMPCQLAFQKSAIEEHECGILDLLWMLACGPCCGVMVRGKIRDKYGIDGSVVTDCLFFWLCSPCAVSQQTRQLDIKGLKPAGVFMA